MEMQQSERPSSQAAQSFDEMLDEHSLHRFMIVRGKVLSSTPEFVSFKRRVRAILLLYQHL